MPPLATGRPGRPAASTREAALGLATEHFLAGERIDVQAIARELGLARATMHRWFQTRELLLGELLGTLGVERLEAIRRDVGGVGAPALLETFDRFNREVAANRGMRALLAQEQERALRILTSSAGLVQPRLVACIARVIEDEAQAGEYVPPIPADVLAYAIVRLAEAFIYNDALAGIRTARRPRALTGGRSSSAGSHAGWRPVRARRSRVEDVDITSARRLLLFALTTWYV
jgi:AcrR family transcriptional regulator